MRASCFSTAALPAALVAVVAVFSCKPARSVDRRDVDADPIALLPPGAVLVARIDARAVFADPALAKSAVALGHALFPIDGEAGFEASRDVDRLLLAEYEGPTDYVGIASGRFDPEKLAALTKAADGSAVATDRYDGVAVCAVGPIVYAVVSVRTLLVGTAGAVRRALDRARAPKPERAVKPWIAGALATSDAQLAVAADFESEPVTGAAAVGPVDLSWVGGLRTARVTGDLGAPGMAVAATLSYADPAQAQRGVDGLRAAARWVKTVGPLVEGVHVPDVQIASRESDVKCAFTVDDSTLRTLGALAPRFLPPSRD